MNIATSIPSCSSSSSLPFLNPRIKRNGIRYPSLQVKAQSFKDNGIVDANMKVLRERIEEVKLKERLERCCKCENGWNYASHHYKPKKQLHQFIEFVGLVGGTIGFTCLTCTFLLCLFSILLHEFM